MNPEHRQGAHSIRFDWGPVGAAAVTDGCDVVVVVDVLSFTTTLTVAVEAGAAVYPYPWDPARAAAYAAERDATVAVGRSRARPGQPSLSPLSLRGGLVPPRLVLPSPNGSALAFGLADTGFEVVGACLRNASAVARWITGSGASAVAVVAAGERWPDGTVRPAVEDLWGAGAVLRALVDSDAASAARRDCSPEAAAAAASFVEAAPAMRQRMRDCASGRELTAKGFAGDVDVAAEIDTCTAVPLLRGTVFVNATTEGTDP